MGGGARGHELRFWLSEAGAVEALADAVWSDELLGDAHGVAVEGRGEVSAEAGALCHVHEKTLVEVVDQVPSTAKDRAQVENTTKKGGKEEKKEKNKGRKEGSG